MKYLFFLLAVAPVLFAEEQPDLLVQAQRAYSKGLTDEAVANIDAFIKQSPESPKGYLARAAIRDALRQYDKSIADYDKAIALDGKLADNYQRRGVARFMAGQIKDCLADFDKYLEMKPEEKPYHWQRGIALYYAGRFEDGAKQFELHRTVNAEDVENAAWHFMCEARWKTPAEAKAALIPIENDSRVPMMKVHELFAGRASEEDVMAAATANHAPPAQLNRQLFYAHLYIGLYFESIGNNEKAKEHLTAAVSHEVSDYMYGVAKVHVQLMKK